MTIRPATADSAAPLLILDDDPQSEPAPRPTYHRTTRRERLERKLEKREEWAQAADRRSAQSFKASWDYFSARPAGQPYHANELAARDRAFKQQEKSFSEADKAEHHRTKAEGLARQLEKNIYSDDPDAIERIREKIEKIRAEVEYIKAFNKLSRKEKWNAAAAREHYKSNPPQGLASGVRAPWSNTEAWGQYYPFELSNRNQEIHRLEKRIKNIEKRNERQAAADNAGGLNILKDGAVNVVTFSEKPPREIIDALKSAGYYWRNGSWRGCKELPEAVRNFQPDQN